MADKKGRPKAFESAEDFENKFNSYIKYCVDNKRFPNIAGFCRYTHITRETFYKQKEYYSDTYNIANDTLEDEVLQDNTYRAQLYLKNKFGYKDKQEVEAINHNLNQDIPTTEQELDKAIDALLKKRNKKD